MDGYKINDDENENGRPIISFRRAKFRNQILENTTTTTTTKTDGNDNVNDLVNDDPSVLKTFVSILSLIDKVKFGVQGLFS
jgi:hypothetical protein